MGGTELIDPSSFMRPVICRMLLSELEFFNNGAQTFMQTNPALRLAYMHVTLLIKRTLPHAEPDEILLPAQRLMVLLNSFGPGDSVSILRHHYISLAALTFSGVADASVTRDRAHSMLHIVLQAIEHRRGFATDEDPSTWDMAIRQMIHRRHDLSAAPEAPTTAAATVQGGLQHLADLAVNQEGVMQGGQESLGSLSPTSTLTDSDPDEYVNMGLGAIDAAELLKYGYFNVLAHFTTDGSSGVTVAPFPSDTGDGGDTTASTALASAAIVNAALASVNENDVAINGNGRGINGTGLANGNATVNGHTTSSSNSN